MLLQRNLEKDQTIAQLQGQLQEQREAYEQLVVEQQAQQERVNLLNEVYNVVAIVGCCLAFFLRCL